MDFETIDWELEAKRVIAAFGVEGHCHFKQTHKHKRELRNVRRPPYGLVVPPIEGYLQVKYLRNYREFSVVPRESPGKIHLNTYGIRISWTNSLLPAPYPCEITSEAFIGALYCLDLLIPEIENELDFAVTAHQKLEWALNFEERLNLSGE